MATIDIIDPAGNTFQAKVVPGGFSVALTGRWPDDDAKFTAVVRDSGYNVIYQGPIPEGF